MGDRVVPHGHLPLQHDLDEPWDLLLLRLLALPGPLKLLDRSRSCLLPELHQELLPVGEVQLVPALVHVVLDEPGHRGDIGVPGPFSPVAMAVVAGVHGQLGRARAVPPRLRVRGGVRVAPAEGQDLDDEEHGQAAETPLRMGRTPPRRRRPVRSAGSGTSSGTSSTPQAGERDWRSRAVVGGTSTRQHVAAVTAPIAPT